jgi:hypothetical protein
MADYNKRKLFYLLSKHQLAGFGDHFYRGAFLMLSTRLCSVSFSAFTVSSPLVLEMP